MAAWFKRSALNLWRKPFRTALVIADEPTGNLDTGTGAEIIELLTSLAGEQTVIIATHDERIAGAADRVVYLSDGLVATEQADATP